MQTGRSFERLVNFSDAVVAIAITLLVLPLVEIPEGVGERQQISALFADHRTELTSFLISFWVIWILWMAHHRTMEYFRAYDGVLIRLHMVWLFTIVALPFTTELLNSPQDRQGAVPLYIATLLLSSLALQLIAWRGRRRQELLQADHPDVQQWLAEPLSVVTVSIMFVALLASLAFPSAGTWVLLLLLLDDPIDKLLARWRGHGGLGAKST